MSMHAPNGERDWGGRVPYLTKAQLAAIVTIATDGIISLDASERIISFNEGAEQLFGRSAAEMMGAGLEGLFPESTGTDCWRKLRDFAIARGAPSRLGERLELSGQHVDGRAFPVEVSLTRTEVDGARVITLVLWDLSGIREAERRERELLDEQSARATAEAAAVRMRTLTEVDRILLSSLDHAALLQEVAGVVVPALADHCVIRLLDDGEWGRIALAHPAPEGEHFAVQLQRRFPLYRDAVGGIHRVLRMGEPLLYPEIDEAVIAVAREDREYLRVLHGLGIHSAIMAPLVARGRLRGSIAFFNSASAHSYGAADLAFLQDLATRLALSLDNARLYREAELELAERRRAEAALRESEARFRVMADMAPVLIWMSDLDGFYHFFNKPWLEFTGRRADEESGEGWLEGVHPEDRDRYLTAYQRAYQARLPIVTEYRLRHQTGEYRWVLDHGVPRFTPEGEYAGYIGSCVDIQEQVEQRQALADNTAHLEELTTELEHTVEELELRREEADAARAVADDASRAKSRFLAVVSHELRTPLNAILGYCDLLDAEVAGPINTGQRHHLLRIQQSALHLLELINKVLTFSRIEAGKEELALELVDLVELARDAVALVEPQAARQGLGLQVMVPERELGVETDPGKVRQILLNLLSNAIKFTEQGEVVFELEEEEEVVVFRVRDTGPGIPSVEHERIFEAFTQGDDTRTRKKGGTGLGLSVSRELARLLGGEIELESRPGEGSIFTVRLPLSLRVGVA